MTRLSLTYAGDHYPDRTYALETGSVQPDGINLKYVHVPIGDLFRRMAQDAEFPASEMSMSSLIRMRSRGDSRLVAIPVFPLRAFRHSQIYVHAAAGLDAPSDLRGKNIGISGYQMTAALWQRALMQHEYGIAPEQIHWWTGGLKTPEYREPLAHDVPSRVQLDRIPADKALEGMLETGELDGLFAASAPEPFQRHSPNVRRLFADYRPVEEAYFRKTGFFPIMHTVVIRRDVYEANQWLVISLLDAFQEAKRRGVRRLAELGTLSVTHPWIGYEIDRIKQLFGRDPFVYGVENNRAILEAMTKYHYEQGLSKHKVDPEELFAPEALHWAPTADVLFDQLLAN
ncbi:MAG: ABC transporter substrate-binding protein [Acidobacteriaceae bacterium]